MLLNSSFKSIAIETNGGTESVIFDSKALHTTLMKSSELKYWTVEFEVMAGIKLIKSESP